MLDTQDTKMTKIAFLTEWEKLRPIVKGHGTEIAELAKVNKRQYQNAVKGCIKDDEVLGRIIRTAKIVADRLVKQYQEPSN